MINMISNINIYFKKENNKTINQGDIFEDIEIPYLIGDNLYFLKFPYIIIVSQDCDLTQDFNKRNFRIENPKNLTSKDKSAFDKFLPSILVTPAFPADDLREGTHLSDIFEEIYSFEKFHVNRINSKSFKKIKNNEIPRYHFLEDSENFHIPELCVDFKQLYSLPRDYLYENIKQYYCSLNVLFRENFSQRFYNFHSRIGLPD